MNWLLVIILIIILLLMIHGWRKGMLRILFSIVAIVVLIVLVAFATPHISGFIKGTYRSVYCAGRALHRKIPAADRGGSGTKRRICFLQLPGFRSRKR